ncbi:unnamed protein product [Symbiodinium natans]|uniref:PPPDE domain-containing protein n=1 Tax=Symbiodinium natans TaxID=878477 RepID=A0A812SC48_9DINO|nr:unnamed protein product [Symbiodinium natans]
MGAAASEPGSRAAGHHVVLAVSSFLGAPDGCWMKDAYHTSVVVDNVEYTFSPRGIVRHLLKGQLDATGSDGVSYFRGMSTISGPEMAGILWPFFKEGSYDVLKKNCNTFSDCALFCLLGERLPIKYRTLEKVAGVLDDVTGVVQALSMCNYRPNPKAQEFEIVPVLKHIEFQTRPGSRSGPLHRAPPERPRPIVQSVPAYRLQL